jgi:hypothetical protein
LVDIRLGSLVWRVLRYPPSPASGRGGAWEGRAVHDELADLVDAEIALVGADVADLTLEDALSGVTVVEVVAAKVQARRRLRRRYDGPGAVGAPSADDSPSGMRG